MLKQQIKSTIRKTISSLYYSTNHYLTRLKGKVIILMYHRVVTNKELNQCYTQPGMYVKNDVFEMQMEFLKEHFEIISFAELLELWKDKKLDRNKRYCVITFDDGWLDNYLYAYPVLRKFGMPATIFLPTSYIGTNQWFWPDKLSYLLQYCFKNDIPLRQFTNPLFSKEGLGEIFQNRNRNSDMIDPLIAECKKFSEEEINDIIEEMMMVLDLELPINRLLLNWQEIEEMSENGISFGSHSCSHNILTKLNSVELQNETAASLHVLKEKRINYVPVFCYPNGNYTDKIIEKVKASGYQAAVSTHFGFEDGFSQNLFGLKRIGIHNDISSTMPLFAYRLSGIEL